MNIAQTRETIERLQAMLEGAPPEVRDKLVASLNQLGDVLKAVEVINRAKPAAGAQAAAQAAMLAPPDLEWKVRAIAHVATEALKLSGELDKVILEVIARRPRGQRQIQRDIDALRSAWEENFGKRRACIEVLDGIVKARTPADIRGI